MYSLLWPRQGDLGLDSLYCQSVKHYAAITILYSKISGHDIAQIDNYFHGDLAAEAIKVYRSSIVISDEYNFRHLYLEVKLYTETIANVTMLSCSSEQIKADALHSIVEAALKT